MYIGQDTYEESLRDALCALNDACTRARTAAYGETDALSAYCGERYGKLLVARMIVAELMHTDPVEEAIKTG
jgi:hypothetical protein